MQYFNRCIVGLFLVTGVSFSHASQNSLDQFLKQKIATFKLDSIPLTSAEIENQSPDWIETAELRLGADNDDDKKRSIALRLNLNSVSSMSVEKEILRLQKQTQNLDQQNNLNQQLETVYSQMLELISQDEILRHMQQRSNLLQTEIKYLRQLAQTSDFNPDDLLQSELNFTQLETLIELQKQDISDLKQSIEFNSEVPKLTLTAEQMLELVTQYQQETSIQVEQAQLELKLAQLELKHEKTHQGLGLNAIQLESESADGKDDVVSVRFDIQIPFSGPGYSGVQKQQKVTEARYKLQRRNLGTTARANQLLQKVKQGSARIFTYEQLAVQLQTRIKKTTNASLILKLKKQHLSQLENILDVKKATRQTYIELLALNGLLAKKPGSNWLLVQ